jgi:hypothetical protein
MPFQWTQSQQIAASPEAVFAAAEDFANAPRRIRGIRKVEMLAQSPDGAVGVGTRFRETRVMFGREMDAVMEVVEFQPGRSYTLLSPNNGCEFRTVVSVRPAGSGSEITMRFRSTPLSLGAKVMDTLMAWLFKGACVKAAGQDLADLKAAVEQTGAG